MRIVAQFPLNSRMKGKSKHSTRTMSTRITNVSQHFNISTHSIWFQAFRTFRAFQTISIDQNKYSKKSTKHHGKSQKAVESPQTQKTLKSQKPKLVQNSGNYEKKNSGKILQIVCSKRAERSFMSIVYSATHMKFRKCSHFAFKWFGLFMLTTTWQN